MARPPVCAERLALRDDGKVHYAFKSAWRDGTKAVVLSGLDFISRLCALIPPPRFHLVHYHGAFSAGSAIRKDIVPGRAEPPKPKTPISLFEHAEALATAIRMPSRHPWAGLLARVFALEISVCPVPGCKGEMRLKDVASKPDHIGRVLAELGLAPRPPTRTCRIPARQLAIPLTF